MLTPKNWADFQHYKNRSPAWIKLHRGLLDDFEFACLPLASRALAPMLWLLASEYDDGVITASLQEIAFRFRTSVEDLQSALTPLIESKFFDASGVLAERKQSACLEREREEEDIEKRKSEKRARDDDWPSDFRTQFWERYPNKVGKPKALNKLEAARRRGVNWLDLMAGLNSYIRDKPPDRQWLNPETFINQERWADQPATVSPANAKVESLASVAKRHAESGISFGERPTGIRIVEGGSNVRLLPQAGGE
jgi:hypothetical protein